MKSRFALLTSLLGAAGGGVLALRSRRARGLARRAYRSVSDAGRARATATANRLDARIRTIETDTDPAEHGRRWRHQTLVSARDALVAVGHDTERGEEPVGAASGNGASPH